MATYAASCNENGYTVILVNGIFNTLPEAQDSKSKLSKLLAVSNFAEPVNIQLGFNPSHLAGGGDLIQSVFQTFNAPISNYDLDTILMQLHPEVTTRKILLVGHSQGSFYTNELYNYLTTHGVPRESIGVYNIATPASYVAGGGRYITSTNDKLIGIVRDAVNGANNRIAADTGLLFSTSAASALRANVTIPREEGWADNKYGGHGFPVYINGATQRIVDDISYQLQKLKGGSVDESIDGCFEPPEQSLSYKTEQALFSVEDTVADIAVAAGKKPIGNMLAAVSGARGIFADVIPSVFTAVASAFGLERSDAQAALVALPDTEPTVPEVQQTSQPSVIPTASKPAQPIEEPVKTAEAGDKPGEDPSSTEQAQDTSNIQTIGTAHFVELPTRPSGGGPAPAPAPTASAATPAPTAAAVLTVDAPAEGAITAASSVSFSGTSDAGAQIELTYGSTTATTTADGAGSWMHSLVLPEGDDVVSISAPNASSVQRSITVDLTPPASTTISMADCTLSLAAAYCLLPTTAADLVWTNAADATAYAVAVNGVESATTTASSTAVTLADNATTTLTVVSYDRAGNSARSATLAVRAISRPLIINEVGWGGTDAADDDQYIELKNITSEPLDLTHISIERSGGAAIALSGSIGASAYLAVERIAPGHNSNTTIVPFDELATASAEQLSLVWNGMVLDQTPAVAVCPIWCAGSYSAHLGSNVQGNADLTTPLSMERSSDDSDGTLPGSWHTVDSYGPWGVGFGSIWGTPGEENSLGLPESAVYCGSQSNLIVANTAYHPEDSSCVYLSRFLTGGPSGVNRFGAIYRGTVSSSTSVNGHFLGQNLAGTGQNDISADAQAGEDFFFAMYEVRTGPAFHDTTLFNIYFTTGSTTPPHGNYVTIPWTYQ
jgi:hypothetical protein